ncbi:hypothetical protein [Streptomyces hilarionis]|nr:hypothetical protein [Streptomyces hilarionis]
MTDLMFAQVRGARASQRNYGRYFGEAVEDIEAFLAGAPVRELG